MTMYIYENVQLARLAYTRTWPTSAQHCYASLADFLGIPVPDFLHAGRAGAKFNGIPFEIQFALELTDSRSQL